MSPTLRRRLSLTLLGLTALNAVGGAIYGIAGAEGVPRAWLAGSPFRDYLVPSLVLGVAVGGSMLVAAIAVARDLGIARRATMAAALVLAVWIVAQVAIIGFRSWLQPAMGLISIVLLALAARRGG